MTDPSAMDGLPTNLELVLWTSLSVNVFCMQGRVGLMLRNAIRSAILCKRDDDLFANSKARKETNVKIITCCLEAIEMQALGWTAMYLLITGALPRPFPMVREYSSSALILLCVHVGRLIYKIYHDLCLRCQVTKALYHLVHFASFFTFLYSRSNIILGLMAIACESSDVFISICKVLELSGIPKNSRWYLLVTGTGMILAFALRGLMPVTVLCTALKHSNPLFMENLDVVMFFFYLTFMLSINLWFIVFSILMFHQHLTIRRLHNFTLSHLDERILSRPKLFKERKPPIYKQCCLMLNNAANPSSLVKTMIKQQPYPDVVVTVNSKLPAS